MTHKDMNPIKMDGMKDRCGAIYGNSPYITCELPPESTAIGTFMHDLMDGHVGTLTSYYYLVRWGRGPYEL